MGSESKRWEQKWPPTKSQMLCWAILYPGDRHNSVFPLSTVIHGGVGGRGPLEDEDGMPQSVPPTYEPGFTQVPRIPMFGFPSTPSILSPKAQISPEQLMGSWPQPLWAAVCLRQLMHFTYTSETCGLADTSPQSQIKPAHFHKRPSRQTPRAWFRTTSLNKGAGNLGLSTLFLEELYKNLSTVVHRRLFYFYDF